MTVETLLAVLYFAVGFVEMGFFMVVFLFSGGNAGGLGLMAVVFFVTVTSALALKDSYLTYTIFSSERGKM